MVNNKDLANKIENIVGFKILEQLGKDCKISINNTNGVDIKLVIDNESINIEVKSCHTFIKNKNHYRKGRFWFKPNDFNGIDIFCFYLTNLRLMRFIYSETLYNYIGYHHSFNHQTNLKITYDKIFYLCNEKLIDILKKHCFGKFGKCSLDCKYCPY